VLLIRAGNLRIGRNWSQRKRQASRGVRVRDGGKPVHILLVQIERQLHVGRRDAVTSTEDMLLFKGRNSNHMSQRSKANRPRGS